VGIVTGYAEDDPNLIFNGYWGCYISGERAGSV
jgi:hypothetical protein